MKIKERIIYYLDIYDGEEQGTIKRVSEDLISCSPKRNTYEILNMIYTAFQELVADKKIELIVCEKMTPTQLHRFNMESKTFYRIIDRNV